jgi:ectoine hydroxylase-related dioxygenase (phytanoyl-CoA dioxygenase family)
MRQELERWGAVSLPGLWSVADVAKALAHSRAPKPAPVGWVKGAAVSDPFMREMARDSRLVGIATEALGPDVILFGAHFIRRAAGTAHQWHADIDSATATRRTVSVWIGVENTAASGLRVVTGSHRHRTIQEIAAERGVKRSAITDEMAVEWAQETEPDAEILAQPMADGDALVFDGRAWHNGTLNESPEPRLAVLFQYAPVQARVQIPDFSQLSWPFRFKDESIRVVPIAGSMDGCPNLLAEEPP